MPLAIAHRVLEAVAADDARDRPEDLLLGHAHAGLDVGEHRRPVEVAAAEVAVARDLAAGQHPRALALRRRRATAFA